MDTFQHYQHKNICGYTGSRHFWKRALERKIPEALIKDVIKFGEISNAQKGRKMIRHKEIYIIFSPRDFKLITINTWADTFEAVKLLSLELKEKLITNIQKTEEIIMSNNFKTSIALNKHVSLTDLT